ncbi:hypothetical protein Tco_1240644 [Tanacetum coccineum]
MWELLRFVVHECSCHDITKLEDIEGTIFDNKVSIEEANQMAKDVTDEEIKKALFDIDDNKAPGPDDNT